MDESRQPTADGAESVWVVEASEPDRRAIAGHLTHAGYAVRLAASGAEALEPLGPEPAAAVLLAVALPEEDGFEVCRRLRARPGCAATPVLLLPDPGTQEAHRRALECGADDCLVKPVERDALLLRLRTLLGARAGSDAGAADEAARVRERNEQRLREVAHDLKAPLQALRGYAELLQAREELTPKGERYCQQILKATARMQGLLDELRDSGGG